MNTVPLTAARPASAPPRPTSASRNWLKHGPQVHAPAANNIVSAPKASPLAAAAVVAPLAAAAEGEALLALTLAADPAPLAPPTLATKAPPKSPYNIWMDWDRYM